MWRAIKGFIPVENNLLRHHVPSNGICFFCEKQIATTEHCLLFCERVRICWKDSRFWTHLKECKLKGFVEITLFLRHKLKNDEFEVWVILAWQIWHFLCKLKHDKGGKTALINEEQGWMFWQVYQEARTTLSSTYSFGIQPGEKKWQPPERGTFRVDVDALFSLNRMKFGVGVIVRNSEGKIVVAMAKPMAAAATVFQAELMAIVAGIDLCKQEQIHPTLIFTDSLHAVRAIAEKEVSAEGFSDELQQIKTAMEQGSVSKILHAYRSVTMAAHHLAQSTVDSASLRVWKFDFPVWLTHVVNLDVI